MSSSLEIDGISERDGRSDLYMRLKYKSVDVAPDSCSCDAKDGSLQVPINWP